MDLGLILARGGDTIHPGVFFFFEGGCLLTAWENCGRQSVVTQMSCWPCVPEQCILNHHSFHCQRADMMCNLAAFAPRFPFTLYYVLKVRIQPYHTSREESHPSMGPFSCVVWPSAPEFYLMTIVLLPLTDVSCCCVMTSVGT